MAPYWNPSRFGVRFAALAVLGVGLLYSPAVLWGQQAPAAAAGQVPKRKAPPRKVPAKAAPTPAAEQPKVKGIWEPVNYSQDLQLTDVFFVSADVGWVSGDKGTILHTKDGGATWTAQLGGDPHSEQPVVRNLRFIDETHGWAVLGDKKLLRTTDGESWEEYGHVGAGFRYYDYAFTSPTNALQTLTTDDYIAIAQSKDGGLTYKTVLPSCAVSLEIDGLPRNVGCTLKTLHFTSPEVGYAVGATWSHVGATDAPAIVILKTSDGGASWTEHAVVPHVAKTYESWYDPQYIFFPDESGGVLVLPWSEKLLVTSDGGRTWQARVAAVRGPIKFADPEVGWSFKGKNFSFTTNGGNLWTTRLIAFPIEVNAFSLPRRDRGYVVGNHGMIYRYRVVPATEEVAKAIPAPAMPVFDSPLDEQVEDLGEEVETLEAELTQAAQAAGVDPNAVPAEAPEEEEDVSGEEETEEATAQVTGWAKDCCGAKIQKLQTVLEAVSTEIPRFTGKYRNLNLVFSGLQTVGQFFGQAQGLKDSVRALRKARDPQAVMSAVGQLTSLVQSFRQTTRQAFQKPPEE